MSIFLKKYKYELLILLLGYLVVLVVNFLLQIEAQNIIYPDSASYYEAAQNVYIYQRGHNLRPMLLAAIQGIPFVFGFKSMQVYHFGFYINLISWLFTAVFFFKICKNYFTPKNAFFITMLLFTFVSLTGNLFHLLSETIYLLFVTVAFYFLQKYYITQRYFYLALFLSLFLSSMLIRPSSKLIAFLFLIYFIKIVLKNYKEKASYFIYGSLMLIVIQCAGIKYQFGNFTISYIDSITYYNYLGTKAYFLKTDKEYSQMNNPRAEYLFSYKNYGNEVKKIPFNDAIDQLFNNTSNLVYAYMSNVYDNTKWGNTCIKDCVNVKNTFYFEDTKAFLYSLSQWQNRITTTIGVLISLLVLFCYYKTQKPLFFMAFYVLYIVFLSGISSSQGDRFHLVVYPFMLILITFYIKSKRVARLQK
jgi:hypothetical protein